MAVTRYRLTSSTTAPAVSPALQSYGHTQTSRRQLLTSDSSALTTSAYTPDGADHGVATDAHHIQFVSNALAAGIQYDVGNLVELWVQGLEAHGNNNLFVQLFVSVVNSSGTQQAVLRSKVADGVELGTALEGRHLQSTLDGSYTTSANDRLVVEISVTGSPGGGGGVQGHNASLRWGGNGAGADQTGDGATNTTFNPWFDIEDTEPTRRLQVSFAELEVPTAPRRMQVSFAEFEVPTAPRRAQVSWAELEVPDVNVDRRMQVSFAEMEIPTAPRRAQVSWAELETGDAPSPDRRLQVSFSELEVPTAPRRLQLSYAAFETTDPPRRLQVSYAAFQVPDVGGGEIVPHQRYYFPGSYYPV